MKEKYFIDIWSAPRDWRGQRQKSITVEQIRRLAKSGGLLDNREISDVLIEGNLGTALDQNKKAVFSFGFRPWDQTLRKQNFLFICWIMTREFAVIVLIYKGLSRTESFQKTIFVGLDDLPADMSDNEIKDYAVRDAEEQLRKSEDFPLYGKNWEIIEVITAWTIGLNWMFYEMER